MRDDITFTMPGGAAVAVQLDCWELGEMLPGHTVKTNVRRRGKGYEYVVRCRPETARRLLDECESRATGAYYGRGRGGEGWDQPQSWGRACRIAAERIRAALTSHEREG